MITALLVGTSIALASTPVTPRVLVFSRTEGFRHDSIPDGIAALTEVAKRRGWAIDFTEDNTVFTPVNLKRYGTVVFLCTTGDVLDNPEQSAFEAFVRAGGGYVGIHSASDTEYDWGWYGQLVGAYFMSHPNIQPGTVRIEAPTHPTMRHLPNPWRRTDEWYDFRTNPRGQVSVLASLDPKSYQGGRMPDDHPVVWAHEKFGGRAWYTAMGHTKESYTESAFMKTVEEAIAWTLPRPKPVGNPPQSARPSAFDADPATPFGGDASPSPQGPPPVRAPMPAQAPLQCPLCP